MRRLLRRRRPQQPLMRPRRRSRRIRRGDGRTQRVFDRNLELLEGKRSKLLRALVAAGEFNDLDKLESTLRLTPEHLNARQVHQRFRAENEI
jgi:hypothetical protein